jgi:hypothetical protein
MSAAQDRTWNRSFMRRVYSPAAARQAGKAFIAREECGGNGQRKRPA